jgi:hypothetical protein
MKQFQLLVSIPPEKVIERFSSVIESSVARAFVGPGFSGRKNFLGRVQGGQFHFIRWRRSKNSFAPSCFGAIEENGSGSTINVNVGAKYTCLVIFAVSFVALFGLIAFAFAAFFVLSGKGAGFMPWLIAGSLVLVATLFLFGLFGLGKWIGKSDEQMMIALFPALFGDVVVPPVPAILAPMIPPPRPESVPPPLPTAD